MPFPILRYSVIFIFGILSCQYIPDYLIELLPLPIFLNGAAYISILIFFRSSIFTQSLCGIFGTILVFLFGIQVCFVKDPSSHDNHLLNFKADINFFSGIIEEGPSETEKSLAYSIRLEKIFEKDSFVSASGKLRLYVRKDSTGKKYEYGDRLLVSSRPVLIPKAGNPHSFDYRSFMASKNVYHQSFCNPANITLIAGDQGNPIIAFSIDIRNYLNAVLSEFIENEDNRILAMALLLGQKDELHEDLRNAFADTGAIHVLAVSGLHVGIIYQLVYFILSFLNRFRYGKIFSFLIGLMVLAVFALITGMSPSVVRAVIMFSLISFSQLINRKSGIYNNLGLAALLILIVEPKMIYDLGFQLSFAAVFSIVFFHPFLSKLIQIENTWVDRLYKLTCVSLAAQIGTLPITLFYFHQFPNYFILTNLIVIPMAGIILSMGLALFAVHTFPFLGSIISMLLNLSLDIIRKGVYLVQSIPHSVFRNIVFDEGHLIFSLVLIAILSSLLISRNKWALYAISIWLLIFSIFQWNRILKISNQSELVFFQSKGNEFAFLKGNSLNIHFSGLSPDSDFQKYSLGAYSLAKNVRYESANSDNSYVENEKGRFWSHSGIIILAPSLELCLKNQPDWIYIDTSNSELILHGNYNPNKGFILANNIPYFIKSKIVEKLESQGSFIHDLRLDGALVIK